MGGASLVLEAPVVVTAVLLSGELLLRPVTKRWMVSDAPSAQASMRSVTWSSMPVSLGAPLRKG